MLVSIIHGCSSGDRPANKISKQKEIDSSITMSPIDTTIQTISNFLLNDLRNDLPVMEADDRRFSFYTIDLNSDGKNEYFIKLESRYFCGSGGCIFLLLNNDLSLNTRFTVTKPPVYILSSKTQGWRDLALQGTQDSSGEVESYTYLNFQKKSGSYPNNPSLINKTKTIPDSIITTLWNDEESHAVHSF